MKYIITVVCDSETELDQEQQEALTAEIFEQIDERAHLPFGFEVRAVTVGRA